MRLWFGLTLLAACAGPAPDETDDGFTTEESCLAGGLPPPTCGEGTCTCCVGCSQDEGLCMGLGAWFALGIGSCHAHPAAGTLEVTAGATALAATEVAVIADQSMEVSARTDGGVLVFVGSGAVGDVTCDGTPTSFAYFETGGRVYRNRPVLGRPPCTVSVTAFGNVGERVEGTFSATLVDEAAPQTTLELTAGTFSIERGPYP